MDFLELTKKRCSVRSFSNQPVEKEILDYILEAGRLAPSAVNLQPWAFLVLQSEEAKEDIRSCYDRDWFKSAPLYIVVCGNHSTSWKRPYDQKDHCDIDVAIATEHIMLAAEEKGIGACWVCNFDPEKCKEILKLPENIEPTVIIPLGYVDSNYHRPEKKRKPMEETVLYL